MGMPLDSQQRKELSSDKHDPACVANNRDLTNTFLTRKYHDWEDSPRYYEEPEQIIKGKDVTQPDCGEVHMEDEDEDVFQDSAHTWHTPFREIKEVKSENRATQTPSPALLLGSGMLPCGLAEEPRRLFRGNAALRLSHFERVGEAMAEDQWGPADRPRQPAARSVEAEIGQKLQMIGDQFHQEHLQLFQINQRHQRQPFLWRLAWALYTLFIERPEGGRPR